MSEGIDDFSMPRSPEHVLYRHQNARATCRCPLNNRIGLIGLQCDSGGGSTQRHWRSGGDIVLFRKFVAEKKHVTIENDLAVHQCLLVQSSRRRPWLQILLDRI